MVRKPELVAALPPTAQQPSAQQPPAQPAPSDHTQLLPVAMAPAQPEPLAGQAQEEVKLRTKLVSQHEFVQQEGAMPAEAFGPAAEMTPMCNTIGPMSPCPVRGFHCVGCPECSDKKFGHGGAVPWAALAPGQWRGAGPIPWEAFGHGEYIGPARTAHVPEYRLRVDDLVDFVFRLTRESSDEPYRLEVSDVVKIESLTAPELDREAMVQPDGSISVRLLGQVPAYGLSVEELRTSLEEKYRTKVQQPTITVSPVKINTRLEELRAAVDNRYGRGGQSREARITPEGTIQLPWVGSISAQGLTLDELKQEVDARYNKLVRGLEVTPILIQRAPRYVYVVGEVKVPGRYTLEAPTTVMQAVALAGGWNVGGNLNQIVVFRRDQNWDLMATKLDVFGALYGKTPCPADEIWLRDSDIVVVPKRSILVADNFIELVFTRGIYGVIPLNLNITKLSSI
ncbi:MAG: polysaccharide biosynthesis/export family protein [Pirellulales bacterium]